MLLCLRIIKLRSPAHTHVRMEHNALRTGYEPKRSELDRAAASEQFGTQSVGSDEVQQQLNPTQGVACPCERLAREAPPSFPAGGSGRRSPAQLLLLHP